MMGYNEKRRSCFWSPTSRGIQMIGLAFVGAIMGMFIALLAGGLQTTVVMNSMKKGMDDMNGQLTQSVQAGTALVNHLKTKFPANQPEVTTRQILGVVENVHKISARAQLLVGSVEPDAFGQTVKNINKFMGAVSPEEIDAVKGHALSIVARVDALVAQIDGAKIDKLLEVAGKLDAAQLNALVATIAKIHEIKIQL